MIPPERAMERTRSILGIVEEGSVTEGRDIEVERRLDGTTSEEEMGDIGTIVSRAVIRRLRICSSSIPERILSDILPSVNLRSATG